jgi:hypothetical protein
MRNRKKIRNKDILNMSENNRTYTIMMFNGEMFQVSFKYHKDMLNRMFDFDKEAWIKNQIKDKIYEMYPTIPRITQYLTKNDENGNENVNENQDNKNFYKEVDYFLLVKDWFDIDIIRSAPDTSRNNIFYMTWSTDSAVRFNLYFMRDEGHNEHNEHNEYNDIKERFRETGSSDIYEYMTQSDENILDFLNKFIDSKKYTGGNKFALLSAETRTKILEKWHACLSVV